MKETMDKEAIQDRPLPTEKKLKFTNESIERLEQAGSFVQSRRHSEEVGHLVNTFKYANERNMFDKRTSA